MFTRTMSGLVLALVIFLAGKSAGLFHQVPWSTLGKTVLAGGAWPLLQSQQGDGGGDS